MKPELIDAIEQLEAQRLVPPEKIRLLRRIALRDLVSVRFELRTLIYAGVILISAGVTLFLKENHERLGPALIASLVGILAAGCLAWGLRRSPPFTRGAAAEGSLATEYVLLLGLLLFASDLAYVESQFQALGPNWRHHLLLVSLVALAAAYRADSRVVLSLALTSFAAWRGLSAQTAAESLGGSLSLLLRWNALGCAALYLTAAFLSLRVGLKPHFASVWRIFGLLLLFSGLAGGVFQPEGSDWILWELPLLAAGAIVAAISHRRRRPLDFSIAVAAASLGTFLALVLWLKVSENGLLVLSLLWAAALVAWTERQMDRHPPGGSRGEGAAAFWAVMFLLVATGSLLDIWHVSTENGLTPLLAVGTLLAAGAAVRWGFAAQAGLAALFGFLFLARFPGGRVLWLAVGLALSLFSLRQLDNARLAPTQRRSWAALLVMSLSAVYAAANLYSLDEAVIEQVGDFAQSSFRPGSRTLTFGPFRTLSALATAMMPILLALEGIRTRRTLLLRVAIVFAALSLLTLQHFVQFKPLWAFLVILGTGVTAATWAVLRSLARRPEGEWRGFTAKALFDRSSADATQITVLTAFAAPQPATTQTATQADFEGGGGASGGGGATGAYGPGPGKPSG